MTRFLYLLSAAAVALALSACTVTVTNGGPGGDDVVPDKDVSTNLYTGGDLAAATRADDDETLEAGESIVYRVNVSTTSRDALYLYLDAELDLSVYSDSGSPIATSSSANYFAAGTNALNVSAEGSGLATADVSANLSCPGSCVILPSGTSDPVLVQVENTSSFERSFDFYAVLRDFEDTSEATSGLEPLPLGTTSGALETLGDVDGYTVGASGTLLFDSTTGSGIEFEAEIRDPFAPGSSPRTISSGQSAEVLFDEEVRVYAVNDRAAVAGKSLYFLTLQ